MSLTNDSNIQHENIFKACPCCGYIWTTREAFLTDSSLKLNGYQVDFEKLEEGLFMFTHKSKNCDSTLALPATDFMDLYNGPRYTERKTLTPECPRYCIDKKQFSRCEAMCECAFVREVVQIVHKRVNHRGAK